MTTDRIRSFLAERRPDGPCLIVDLDVVRENYQAFSHALPDTRIFYAVKANPAPEVLKLLADMGSCFDTASVAEVEMAEEAIVHRHEIVTLCPDGHAAHGDELEPAAKRDAVGLGRQHRPAG